MTTDDLLKQGIVALNAGQKEKARKLLTQVVQQDEHSEMGWLWLSGAVETDEYRRICLENVLAINPNNSIAQRGIKKFQGSSPVVDSTSGIASREATTTRSMEETRTGVKFLPDEGETTIDETHGILRQAVAAIKSGEKDKGRQLLTEVIERDDDNEIAWFWMARCVADRDVKRECFERVLAINPDNTRAIEGLKRLEVLSKTEASSSKHKKMTKQQTRLVIGLGSVVLVLACIVVPVGIWWTFSSGLLQLGSAAPLTSNATATPSVEGVYAKQVKDALTQMEQWQNGPVRQWEDCLQEVPSWLITICFTYNCGDESWAKLQALADASQELIQSGSEVKAAFVFLSPPTEVQIAHQQVIECLDDMLVRARIADDMAKWGTSTRSFAEPDPCMMLQPAQQQIEEFIARTIGP